MDKVDKIRIMLRTFPTALDLWIALAIGLYAFGKEVPWILWGIIVAEALCLILRGKELKEAVKS